MLGDSKVLNHNETLTIQCVKGIMENGSSHYSQPQSKGEGI